LPLWGIQTHGLLFTLRERWPLNRAAGAIFCRVLLKVELPLANLEDCAKTSVFAEIANTTKFICTSEEGKFLLLFKLVLA
jgi:hypothetical protein